MRKKGLFWLMAVMLRFGVAGMAWAAQGEIRVGAINDMTGATSDVGKDYALGIAEAIAYVNDIGGINGKKIKLFQYDYGYRIPEAVTTYKRFRDFDKVVAVLGWGTGDTEALSPTITKDRMPYVSASYSAHLTDPKKTPYNIFFCTDYSSVARSKITAWHDQAWKKDPAYKARVEKKEKPRFSCFYAAAVPAA